MDKKLKNFLIKCVESKINRYDSSISYHQDRYWDGDNKWDIKKNVKQLKRQRTIAENYLNKLLKIK